MEIVDTDQCGGGRKLGLEVGGLSGGGLSSGRFGGWKLRCADGMRDANDLAWIASLVVYGTQGTEGRKAIYRTSLTVCTKPLGNSCLS